MKSLTGTIAEDDEREKLEPLPSISSLPPVSAKEVKKIYTVLTSLKKDGKPLVTSAEANNLAKLRLRNGDMLLDMEENWFVYEVSWMLSQVGYEITYNFLSIDWEKILGSENIRKKMLFENPLMAKSKEKFAVDMEIYRNRPEPVLGGEPCLKCKSSSTVSVEKQVKSADEQVTIRVVCLQCGFRWTAQ